MKETPDQSKPKVVCILGMHRSGTSALTRIANLIGVYLGSEKSLRVEPAPDNAKGHWEHKEIELINEAILQRFGGSWHEPPILPAGWERSPAIDDLRNDARQLIREQFAAVSLWGWKDPRTCLTLRFWQQFFSDVHYVLCMRNPVAVVRSLEHRDGFSAEKSFQLWLTYVCSALKYSEGKPRITVFYEDLIRTPGEEINRIAEFLDQPEHVWQRDTATDGQAFIEKGLQHHSSPLLNTTFQSNAERSAKALYLAQRICATAFANGESEQLSKALETLTPDSNNVTDERDEYSYAKQVFERNEMVGRLWGQIEEQARVLAFAQAAAANTSYLSDQLRQKELELERIKNTAGFRVLSHCRHNKRKYFPPFMDRSRSKE